MRGDDPAAAGSAKRSAATLRDARAALRRLDRLLATAQGENDPSVPDIAAARIAVERLVTQLARHEAGQRRRAAEAVRRAARQGAVD